MMDEPKPTDPPTPSRRARIDADLIGEPREATSTPSVADAPIRRGSPFASVIAADPSPISQEDAAAWSAQGSLLRAASWASGVVLLFSIACAALFPAGGVLVAGLGSGLAIAGLFSSQPVPATLLLVSQAAAFTACVMAIGG